MKNTLLVVADLGGLKAYKLENNTPINRTPHLELIEQFDNAEAHEHLDEKLTDNFGRFPRGTGAGQSAGERHNIILELRKRFVRRLAQRLNCLGRNPEIERCFLAASKEINHQLVDELEPPVRAKVEKNVPADLTKVERAELLRHF